MMTTNNPTAAIPLEVLERAARAIAEEFDSVTILSDYYKEKLARAALLAAGWAEMAAELAAARSLLVTRVEAARLDEAQSECNTLREKLAAYDEVLIKTQKVATMAQRERDEARAANASIGGTSER